MPSNAEIFQLKYKGVKEEIAEEIELLEAKYFREDKPVPFCGLFLYPATVRDYEIFSNCSSCLTLNKNEDPQGIRMSHLDYLISKVRLPGKEGIEWSYKVQKLFEIIFHLKNGIKCGKCGRVIPYGDDEDKTFETYLKDIKNYKEGKTTETPVLKCPDCGQSEDFSEMIKIIQDEKTKKNSLVVDGHVIDKSDYERLRIIVLFQNFPDYRDDSWVDADVKRDFEEKMKMEREKNDTYATIEQKVTALSISTNYKYDDIWSMSIRRFTMALGLVDDLINYKIMRTAVSSGFVSLPKGKSVDHWIWKPYKDMYGDAYKSLDEAQGEAHNLG